MSQFCPGQWGWVNLKADRDRDESSRMLSGEALCWDECCPGQIWVKLNAVWDSAESSWMLSVTALSRAECCPGQRWVELNAVRDRDESSWTAECCPGQRGVVLNAVRTLRERLRNFQISRVKLSYFLVFLGVRGASSKQLKQVSIVGRNNTDNFVIYSTLSGVNCRTYWYFGLFSAFQVLIAEYFGILRTLSGINCGQFWYFPLVNENNLTRIRTEYFLHRALPLYNFTTWTNIYCTKVIIIIFFLQKSNYS